ncbi:hypothetical protein D3C86_2263830 [compost metagenome]
MLAFRHDDLQRKGTVGRQLLGFPNRYAGEDAELAQTLRALADFLGGVAIAGP